MKSVIEAGITCRKLAYSLRIELIADTMVPTIGIMMTATKEYNQIFESSAHGTPFAEEDVNTTTMDQITSEKTSQELGSTSKLNFNISNYEYSHIMKGAAKQHTQHRIAIITTLPPNAAFCSSLGLIFEEATNVSFLL
jgi:hypothetical protein